MSSESAAVLESQGFFSLDRAQGYFNRFLYRHGLSGNPQRVIVGQQGWLFSVQPNRPLKNKVAKSALPERVYPNIANRIERFKKDQRWLARQGIMSLLVIVPKKQSVYSKWLPDEFKTPATNRTDEFMSHARKAALNVLDLRQAFKKDLNKQSALYFKTDSHWNRYGAYLGYLQTLSTLNSLYGADIKAVQIDRWRWINRSGGDLAYSLKIDTILDRSVDQTAMPVVDGVKFMLCIRKLSSKRMTSVGRCDLVENHSVRVDTQPHASFTQQALNRMNVLWLRDSFGDNNSEFYQQTFSRVWEVHYRHYENLDGHEWVEKLHPDLVIYQIAEQALGAQTMGSTNHTNAD